MTNRYELTTSRKDREGKTRWTRVGTMFPMKEREGFMIKLDSLPLPNSDGEVWVSAFPPEQKEQDERPARQQAGGAARSHSRDMDDDIPF